MAVLVLPGVLKDIQRCDVWQPTSPPAHDVKANQVALNMEVISQNTNVNLAQICGLQKNG